MPATTKPPYSVPTMTEIRSLPWNGLRVVSTFCGAGGSSLGYRMAGYRVAWASEFIDAARETYRANASVKTILDGRDIREVRAEDVIEASGIPRGEIDIFDGSPPCASFSTAGKRERGWGKQRKYSDTVQRTDDLFFEYARLVRELQPRVLVAENVSGLVKGTAKGYFVEILRELESCGYRVACRLLDAQWLGVPQARQRTIFVGVRRDLERAPVFPEPWPYRYTIRDAIPWIVSVEEANGHNSKGLGGHRYLDAEGRAFPTVQASRPVKVEAESDISRYCTGREWDKLRIGEQSEKYFNLVKTNPDAPSPTICASHGSPGIASVTHPFERRKFSIAELRRICSFPDDFVLTGTYPQQWERLGRAVPPLMMRAIAATIRDRIFDGGRRVA